VGQPFTIYGWALYTNPSNSGVDAVDVWGCPVLNCTTPTYWGAATIGQARSDVAAAYGSQYLNSGYTFVMSGLTPNTSYYAKVYARSAATGQWTEMVRQFTATATPILAMGAPTHLQSLTTPVAFWGRAIAW